MATDKRHSLAQLRWLTVAAIYLSLTITLSAVAARLETRARRKLARA